MQAELVKYTDVLACPRCSKPSRRAA